MKIIIAGDFCPQQRAAISFDNNDFASALNDVKSIVDNVDYAIVNLECPVCYSGESPIEKIGPNLRCSEKGIDALRWAGFGCVTLANNHFYDYGDAGVRNTLEKCKKSGIDIVGGGMTLKEASSIHYKKISGNTLAIINCCEHEFSIASDTHGGSNPLNPVQQYYDIKKAKNNADYVIVIVHGGHEHFNLPSPRMQDTYRFFIDAGADVVLNHHQHCISGYEVYKGKPIFYGLGNFCFDRNKSKKTTWYDGYMVEITFNSDNITFECLPYTQYEDKASIVMMSPTQASHFNDSIKKINSIIENKSSLTNEVYKYYQSSSFNMDMLFEPFNNRLFRFMRKKGLLPSLFSREKLLKVTNYIYCESHRDKLLFCLLNKK